MEIGGCSDVAFQGLPVLVMQSGQATAVLEMDRAVPVVKSRSADTELSQRLDVA